MRQKLLAAIIAFIACAFAASAQNPVSWSASCKMTSETEGVVTLTGVIADGWHVYGLQIPDGGPAPTKLFYTPEGVTFTGNAKVSPKPKRETDDIFGIDLTYWEKKVTFTRAFKITNPSHPKVTIKVSYMSCNDSNCMPPKTETLTVDIK